MAAGSEKREACAEAVGASIAAAFGETVSGQPSNKRRKLTAHKGVDLALNRAMAFALDHSLRSAGLDLRTFLPEVVLKPLKPHESRYFVELGAERNIDGVSNRRACIWDANLEKGRLELPRRTNEDGNLNIPSLHKSCDKGSIGLPMANWADLYMSLRSTTMEDKWHRFWNDLRGGLVSAKLWIVVCERTVVFNMLTAPYGGHGFCSQVHEASREYFQHRTPECPIFASLYEDSV